MMNKFKGRGFLMIKLVRAYVFTLVLIFIFLSGQSLAQTLTYQGLECLNAANADDLRPNSMPVQSRFEVIEMLDDGMYRLSLTGGLPRFDESDQNICIDSDTAIGFAGIPDTAGAEGLPLRLDRIDATAYFNGQELIISVNSIYTDLSQFRGPFTSFSTSRVQPISNTMIFDFDGQDSSFVLRKIIHNRGFVHTRGSTGSLTPFIETLIPSFRAPAAYEIPRILTPPSTGIVYRLEY